MRKLITTIAMAGMLGLSSIAASNAAPVPGFEAQYAATFTACTLPVGTVADCEAAITAYAGALAAAVDLAVANQSFTELRAEVFAANAEDVDFQAEIDAVFEALLPESGAVATSASPT